MLSPTEADALARGQELKRYVRSAAALRDIYDDTALADAVGRTRMAVGKWWRGVRPEPDAIRALGAATGLSVDELTRYLYFDGPPPTPPVIAPPLPPLTPEQREAARDYQARRTVRKDGSGDPPRTPPRSRRATEG